MTCCDPPNQSPLETIPAGLSSLPRQLRGFPEVRRDLLKALGANTGALEGWSPSGEDFGLMWLEMWAYISDVLGFYDERTANETYIRTAVRRPSLRRIVELLGYTPGPGVAATAKVAAIADGAVAVTLPPATGFRSGAFGTEKPQVFETTVPSTIHPLKNKWTITKFKRRPTVDVVPDVSDTGGTKDQKKAGTTPTEPNVRQLLFETQSFGLTANELVLFESRQIGATSPVIPPVSLVTATENFAGKDSITYVRVTLEPAVRIAADVDLSLLRARRPTLKATPTYNIPFVTGSDKNAPPTPAIENIPAGTQVYFDLPPSTFRRSDPIIVARNLGTVDAEYAFATIESVLGAAVTVTSIPSQTIPIPQPEGDPLSVEVPSPTVPACVVVMTPSLSSTFVLNGDQLTFLYNFVEGGQPTNTGKTELGVEELAGSEGVPLDGVLQPSPDAAITAETVGLTQGTNVIGVLEQEFLIADAVQNGAAVDGRILFTADGRASFQALAAEQLPEAKLKLPITIYGNILDTTRGESVFGEVLGNGDGRLANQSFKLRKKPLTYLPFASADGSATSVSTLQIYVGGVLWSEVRTFFGTGPEDAVYTVRHDDEQNTFLTFGDGVRGSRLPSGVKNVVADYRFGAGEAAPPAGSINQLAGAVKGLRSVRAPVAAAAGKDPDAPEELRTNAPRTALLFGRAVSAPDFEALARLQPGIVQANAEWLWIEAQMQAGVVVQYIGTADPATVAEALRAQSDPTIPVEVTQAQPIPTTASIGVEVNTRYVKEAVAASVAASLTAPGTGVLSLEQATIGGTFWPSTLYEAVARVPGALAVSGVTFSTGTGGPVLSNSHGTCIETGKYLDFSQPGSVTVTGIDPLGSVAPI